MRGGRIACYVKCVSMSSDIRPLRGPTVPRWQLQSIDFPAGDWGHIGLARTADQNRAGLEHDRTNEVVERVGRDGTRAEDDWLRRIAVTNLPEGQVKVGVFFRPVGLADNVRDRLLGNTLVRKKSSRRARLGERFLRG